MIIKNIPPSHQPKRERTMQTWEDSHKKHNAIERYSQEDHIMKKSKRFIAGLLAVIMLTVLLPGGLFLSVPAQAAPVTLAVGNTVYAVDRDGGALPYTIDVVSTGGNLTISDNQVYAITGGSGLIKVAAGNPVIILNGVSRSGTSSQLQIAANASATVILMDDTVNSFSCNGVSTTSSAIQSGIHLPPSATLVIQEGFFDDGSLNPRGTPGVLSATGGDYAAGIGGGPNQSGGIITIEGGVITATSGGVYSTTGGLGNGAGIGGGGGYTALGGHGGTITICGTANVTARSKNDGAGIGSAGGGTSIGSGGIINIFGNAIVTATSDGNGAGIGGGGRSTNLGTASAGAGGTINISGNAVVTSTANGNGAGIGGGGSPFPTVSAGAGGTISIFADASGNVPTVIVSGSKNDLGPGINSANLLGLPETITITSGNVHAVHNKTATVTNGYGDELGMVWVAGTAGTAITTLVIPKTPSGTYNYDAIASTGDKAYVWLPFGEAKADFITAGNDAKIYNGSDTVTISAEAEHTHFLGYVVGLEWFRVPVSDTTNYALTNATFATAYGTADPADADSEAAPSNSKNITFTDITADKNAHYWVRVIFENYDGPSYEYYDIIIDNYYTTIDVSVQDVDTSSGSAVTIKPYEKLSGAYGLPYDLDGTTVLTSASHLGFDVVSYTHNVFRPTSHWILTMPALTIAASTFSSLITLDDKISNNLLADAGSTLTNRFYTAEYDRNSNWCELEIKFVDIAGNPFFVDGGGTVDSTKIWVPLDQPGGTTVNNFRNNGGTFLPPTASSVHEARGWYVSGSPHTISSDQIASGMIVDSFYYTQNDFTEFNPKLGNITVSAGNGTLDVGRTLYIVYAAPAVRLVENHFEFDVGNGGKTTIPKHIPTNYVIDTTTTTYEKQSLTTIPNMVCVGFEVLVGATEIIPFTKYDPSGIGPDESQLGLVWARIDEAIHPVDLYDDEPVINFYYEKAVAGIPISEAAYLTTRWRGVVPVGDLFLTMTAQSAIVDAPTRAGRPITRTNDGSTNGNQSHVIAAEEFPNSWFFDMVHSANPANPEKQTVTPASPGDKDTIIFYYKFSTNGHYPDVDQYITEQYKMADGSSIPGGIAPNTTTSSFVDTTYTKTAPEIPGYVAVGAYRGDYTGSEVSVPCSTTLSFHRATGTPSEVVTFIYLPEAKLHSIHRLTTNAGDIDFAYATVIGYHGEIVTQSISSLPNLVLVKVELDTATQTEVTPGNYAVALASTAPKELIFYYKELHTYTTLTINGLKETATGEKLYSLTLRFETTDMVTDYDVDPAFLPMLAPTWVLKNGEESNLEDIDITDNQEISLVYVSGFADVTIYTKFWDGDNDDDNDVDVLSPITIPKCVSGSPYSYLSPSIPNHQLVDKTTGFNATPYTEVIPVVNTLANKITFYYKAASGNQLVIYKDSETGNEFGRELVDVTSGVETTIPIPSIVNYTNVTATAEKVTWDGVSSLTPIVYEYTRDKVTLTLTAKDTLTGDVIKNGVTDVTFNVTNRRVLENYNYLPNIPSLTSLVESAHPGNYRLAAQGSTLHYIELLGNEAVVWYTPMQSELIPVEVRVVNDGKTYDANDVTTYTLLQTYFEPAALGETITFADERIPTLTTLGYVYDAAKSNLTAEEGTTDIISLVYNDNRFTTTISNNLDSVVITDKTVIGQSILLSPPYKAGAVAIKYSTDGGSNWTDILSGFTGLSVYTATDIIFYYETYVDITVVGKDSGNNTLYSFTKRVTKSTDRKSTRLNSSH